MAAGEDKLKRLFRVRIAMIITTRKGAMYLSVVRMQFQRDGEKFMYVQNKIAQRNILVAAVVINCL